METKIMVLLVFVIVAALSISIAVYFLLQPGIHPLDPKAEYKMLIEKMKNMPNSRIEYALEFGVPYLGSMAMTLTADMIWYVLSHDKQRLSFSMELFGYSASSDMYFINKKAIVCSQTSALTTEPKTKCELITAQNIATFPGMINTQQIIDKMLEDSNISFAGEKEIAKRSAKCFNIEASAADLNLNSTLFSLASRTEQELKKPNMPTGFTTLPGSSLPKGSKINALVCLDKEYGFPALIDMNFTYKQLYTYTKNAKNPLTVTFTMKLKSFKLNAVTEKDLEIPVAFSLSDLRCHKKKIEFSVIPYKELSGDLKIKISERTSIIYEQQKEEKTEAEKTLRNVKLKPFEKRDFNISLDKEFKGYKNVQVCIGNECASNSCYFSTLSFANFYVRASCEADKTEITLEPYKNIAGDVNITLYRRVYDYNTYEYRKIPVANKVIPNLDIKSGQEKVFFLTKKLSKGEHIVEVCVDDECRTRTCYVYSDIYITPTPTPTTPTPSDINAKMQDCLTRITDEEAQTKCLIGVLADNKLNPDACKQLAPLCDKLKELVWKHKDSLREIGGGAYTYTYLYEVPECYALYAYYSNLTDKECDKLSGYVISYEGFTFDWQKRCKEKFVLLVSRGGY